MDAYFEIPGQPRGKQRPRTVRNKTTGRTMTYTPEQTVMYENLIKCAYTEANKGIYLKGSIEARIVAFFPIPKSTSDKKRRLMINREIMHTKKIDCDNLAKAVLDALNKVAYDDDSQVSRLIVNKYYDEQPRVLVWLKEI